LDFLKLGYQYSQGNKLLLLVKEEGKEVKEGMEGMEGMEEIFLFFHLIHSLINGIAKFSNLSILQLERKRKIF